MKKVIVSIIKVIMNMNKPVKMASPPRFCIKTREKRVSVEESRGNKGGLYPW